MIMSMVYINNIACQPWEISLTYSISEVHIYVHPWKNHSITYGWDWSCRDILNLQGAHWHHPTKSIPHHTIEVNIAQFSRKPYPIPMDKRDDTNSHISMSSNSHAMQFYKTFSVDALCNKFNMHNMLINQKHLGQTIHME